MQNLNKFESCYPALGNVSAINAVKAVGAKNTSLSTQVLDFLFGNVDIDGSKTATGDSGFNFVLKEGIKFQIFFVSALGMNIEVSIADVTSQLCANINFLTDLTHQILIILYQLLLLFVCC